ncbi:unnamed protein product [Jaminaea pallidilutea]
MDNRYRCVLDSPDDRAGQKIGDWNYLKPNTHEISTPCGTGGFAGSKNHCPAALWGVCVNFKDLKDEEYGCWGLGHRDDCEWPVAFSKPPPSLVVYFK